jgi:DNA-binding MarR family transcriptional regulator
MDERRSGKIADSLVSLIRIFNVMKSYGESSGIRFLPIEPQYAALGFLGKEDLSMSELGRRLHRSRPNMTAIIDGMIADGTVKRLHDARDRRIVKIAITAKGKRFLDEKKKAVKASIAKNLGRLGDKDLETLCASLESINRISDKITG